MISGENMNFSKVSGKNSTHKVLMYALSTCEHIVSKGGRLSYPTIIVDDKVLINGFRKDKFKEILGI